MKIVSYSYLYIDYTDQFIVTFIPELNPTYYASIILDAFNNLLCSNYAGIIGLGLIMHK